MTASLPMYDTPTTRAANDRFWALIRETLGEGPEALDRASDPHDTWENPNLILSQTCSLPFRSVLHDKVSLVGTPDYGVRGCPPGYYKSYVVIRANDPRRTLQDFAGTTLARNDVRSQSGWAAIEGHLAEQGIGFSFADNVLDTGGHFLSAQAVADGRADIAALDAVTWSLIKREHPLPRRLRVLLSTRPTPGLPYITSLGRDADHLFPIIKAAIDALSARDRARLLLKGIVRIPASEYLAEPLPPA
ncbi:phosphate/phosphite/phosphonate ABC transporter substrate-binding protein [Roseobacter sp. EG26]|uniref:phosphate/phosphite/phosphonate ABC transporter substrate-binding protein n=1 Tax=Roseobacter sp. EG26 TaxID=3412477 RepID=UPI003CE49521